MYACAVHAYLYTTSGLVVDSLTIAVDRHQRYADVSMLARMLKAMPRHHVLI